MGCPDHVLPRSTVRKSPSAVQNVIARVGTKRGSSGTGISAFKLYSLGKAFSNKNNYLYNIEGSILSGAEIGFSMIVGSLPPLRKPFDRFLKLILPDSLMESKSPNPSVVLPIFSTKASQATSGDTGDDESAIFHIDHNREEEPSSGAVGGSTGDGGNSKRKFWFFCIGEVRPDGSSIRS